MVSSYRTFLLVGFLDVMSVFFILPYIDIHAKELGFNHIQIGIIGAIYPGCQMISSPIVGSLSDVMGRRPIFLLCLIICSFAYFWLGLTSSLLVFLGIRAALGIFKHTQSLTKGLAPDYLDDQNDVTALYGKLTSLGGLGIALGSVLSGYVMEALPESGFTIMCVIVSAICILNAGLLNSLPDIPKAKKDDSETVLKATKLFDPIVSTFNQTVNNFYTIDWTTYWDIFLYQFLLSMSMGLYFNNSRLFLITEHDVSPSFLGYITTIQGIASSITNEKVSSINNIYVNDRDYSQRIFHIFLVMVLSLIGLALVPGIKFYIALLIPTAVCFALARVVTLVIVSNRSVTGNRGTLIGAFDSVSSVSGILAPIIGGIINHYLGVTYVFYTGAMIASIGLVLTYKARSISLQEKIK